MLLCRLYLELTYCGQLTYLWPIAQAIERAFDNSEICFYQDEVGTIRLHVLADELRDTQVSA